MTRQEQIRVAAEGARQRRAIVRAIDELGLADLLGGSHEVMVGVEAQAIRERAAARSAAAFRSAAVVPDGFTLTVCYGELSLLPRVAAWARKIHPKCSYWVNLQSKPQAPKDMLGHPAGLVLIDGATLQQVVQRLTHRGSWPDGLFWLDQAHGHGVVFDEFAGTPHVPGGDDLRIFEVTCWQERSGQT